MSSANHRKANPDFNSLPFLPQAPNPTVASSGNLRETSMNLFHHHLAAIAPRTTMPALTSKASSLVGQCARTSLRSTTLRAATAAQRRNLSEVSASSSFDSPFKGVGGSDTTKIPSFAAYKSSGGEQQNRLFQYFMVGTLGAITAMGAKATVQGTWRHQLMG